MKQENKEEHVIAVHGLNLWNGLELELKSSTNSNPSKIPLTKKKNFSTEVYRWGDGLTIFINTWWITDVLSWNIYL